jgi:hypothetical protein
MIKLSDIKIELIQELAEHGDCDRAILAVTELQYKKRTGTDIEISEIEAILLAVEFAAYEVSSNLRLTKNSSVQHDRRLKCLISKNLHPGND